MSYTDIDKQLMDEFCVMLERADRKNGESGDYWTEKLENFCHQIYSQAKADGYREAVNKLLKFSGPIDNIKEFIEEEMSYE